MDSSTGRYRTGFAVVAAVVPLMWIVLSLIHPHGEHMLEGETSTWLLVHWGQLAMIPVLGVVLLYVLGQIESIAATIARIALVAWVALFGAFGAVAGITTAILVDGGFTGAAEYLWDQSVTVGGTVAPVGAIVHWVAWPIIVVASGFALRARGAPKIAYLSMFAALLLMFPEHGDYWSVIGSVALTVAVFTSLRYAPARYTEPSRGVARSGEVSVTGTAS